MDSKQKNLPKPLMEVLKNEVDLSKYAENLGFYPVKNKAKHYEYNGEVFRHQRSKSTGKQQFVHTTTGKAATLFDVYAFTITHGDINVIGNNGIYFYEAQEHACQFYWQKSVNEKITELYNLNAITNGKPTTNDNQYSIPGTNELNPKPSFDNLVQSNITPDTVLNFVPETENLSDAFPQLIARGIQVDTLANQLFLGRLGSKIEVGEKINYRLDDCLYPNLTVPYYNLNGDVIAKEFKNQWNDKSLSKRQKDDPTEKRSFSRFLNDAHRGNALWTSNVPENVTHIFIGENPIDILSYYQNFKDKPGYQHLDTTLFVGCGGTLSNSQIRLVNQLMNKHQISNVILSGDFDKQGQIYNLALFSQLEKQGSALPKFLVQGQNGSPGFTITYDGDGSSKDKVFFEYIRQQIKNEEFIGGAGFNLGETSARLYFTEQNFVKAKKIINKIRPSDRSGIKFQSALPKTSKDWNDFIQGKNDRDILKHGFEAIADKLPIDEYYKVFHRPFESNFTEAFKHLAVREQVGRDRIPSLMIFTKEKNTHIGQFNLHNLQFEPFPNYATILGNEEVGNEIKQLKDFYKPKFFSREYLADYLSSGFVLENGKILKNGEEKGWLNNKGKIELNDEEFHDNDYNSLELIQGQIDKGLSGNNWLHLKENTLFIDIQNDKSELFSAAEKASIPVALIGADHSFTLLQGYDSVQELVDPQLDLLANIWSERMIPSIDRITHVRLIENKRLFYGNYEVGIYYEDNKELSLFREYSTLAKSESFCHEMERLAKMGYANYVKQNNYKKRYKVNLITRELFTDKIHVGHISHDGTININASNYNEDIDLMVNYFNIPKDLIKIIPEVGIAVETRHSINSENISIQKEVDNSSLVELKDSITIEVPKPSESFPLPAENKPDKNLVVNEGQRELNTARINTILKEISSDPKFDGLIGSVFDSPTIVGNLKEGKGMVSIDDKVPGYFSSKLPASGIYETSVYIFENPSLLVDQYYKNRSYFVYSDERLLVAPLDQGSEKITALFSALRAPKEVVIIGSESFKSRVKPFLANKVHSIKDDITIQNKGLASGTPINEYQDLIKLVNGADIKNVFVDDSSYQIYFPALRERIATEGDKYFVFDGPLTNQDKGFGIWFDYPNDFGLKLNNPEFFNSQMGTLAEGFNSKTLVIGETPLDSILTSLSQKGQCALCSINTFTNRHKEEEIRFEQMSMLSKIFTTFGVEEVILSGRDSFKVPIQYMLNSEFPSLLVKQNVSVEKDIDNSNVVSIVKEQIKRA